MKKLYDRLRDSRKTARMSQKELALKLEMHEQTIIKYEQGKRVPDANFLYAICKLLNVSPGWLLTGEGEMKVGQGGERVELERNENLSERDALYQLLASSFKNILYKGKGERRRKIINDVMDYAEEIEPE